LRGGYEVEDVVAHLFLTEIPQDVTGVMEDKQGKFSDEEGGLTFSAYRL
jgi:hypothetical protein